MISESVLPKEILDKLFQNMKNTEHDFHEESAVKELPSIIDKIFRFLSDPIIFVAGSNQIGNELSYYNTKTYTSSPIESIKFMYKVEDDETEQFLIQNAKTAQALYDLYEIAKKHFPEEDLCLRYSEYFDAVHLLIKIRESTAEEGYEKHSELLDEYFNIVSNPDVRLYILTEYV